ncbi:MAG: hypothetical protein KGJ23_11500 [Euryarchaeota archaeon]|nr:hypothetical protein [Euryarchaeota archaeon]MDE1837220.1 hypothetical protein [Euryarchaeota archaeon]
MPTRSANPPKNGADSVSRGLVFLKADSPDLKPTPHCVHHGAMLKVGVGIWRGPECGCGAWEPEECPPPRDLSPLPREVSRKCQEELSA